MGAENDDIQKESSLLKADFQVPCCMKFVNLGEKQLFKVGWVFSFNPFYQDFNFFTRISTSLLSYDQGIVPPSEPRKKTSYFPLYCLINRDPYNGLL